MTSQCVTVGVYSKQDIVREGIVSLLSSHPDKVTVVATPTHAGDPDPDVVLYDVMALLEGDTRLLGYLVDMTVSKVLAVGHDLRPDLVGQALTTGVDGFFSIGADEKELLAAVESAATGWELGDPGDDPTVGSSESAARANQLGADVGLTEREAQILSLIARDHSNQQIASEMFLSINSVKTYIRSAYRKIGVQSRGAAVGWAIRHGFASTS
jgi:DNA-binding NarL/FixJ family response regulator